MRRLLPLSLPVVFVLTIPVWFWALGFQTPASLTEVAGEGAHVLVALLGYAFLSKLGLPLLQLGWALLSYALWTDLLDEFTLGPVTELQVFQSLGKLVGLSAAAVGFYHSHQVLSVKLRRSQRMQAESSRLAAIVESSDDAILSANLEGTILDWNPAAERLLGYAADEVIGRSLSILVPANRSREVSDSFEKLRRGETIDHFETERLHKDGSHVPVSLTVSPVRDETGGIVGFSGIGRDISRWKRAEQALLEKEAELRRVMTSISDAVWSAEIDSLGKLTYRYYSPVVEKTTSRPPEFFLPGPECWLSTIHPEDRPHMEEAFARVSGGGCEHEEAEYRIVHPDGAIRWVRDSVNVRRLEDGRIRLDGAVSDITARKRAEAELRRERDFTSDVLASLTAEIAVLDKEGAIVTVNEAWRRFERENPASPAEKTGVGMNYLEVCRLASGEFSDGARRVATGIEAVLQGARAHFVHEYACPSPAKMRWFLLSATPLRGLEGGAVVSHLDITERKLAEERLKASEGRYRAVVEDQSEFIVRWLPDGTRTFVNQAYCDYFAQPHEQMIGTSFMPLVAEEDRQALGEKFDRLTPKNPAATDEHQVIRPDGSIGWQQWTDRAVFNDEGRVVELQSIGRDISERKKAQIDLETRVRQQAAVAELGQLALTGGSLPAFFDQVACVVAETLNVDYCKILELVPGGKSRLLWKGRDNKERKLGEDGLTANRDQEPGPKKNELDSVLEEEIDEISGFRSPRIELEHGIASGIRSIIRGCNGVFGVLGAYSKERREFTQDDSHFLQAVAHLLAGVIERKRTEEELRAERDYSTTVIDGTWAMICRIDPKGLTTFINRAGERITGYRSAQIVGQNWWKLLYPGDSYRQVQGLFEELKKVDVFDCEMTLTTREGRKRTVSWSTVNRRDEAGRLIEILGFGNDVTEHKELEEQFRHSQKMEAVGRLAGGVAHDFNNLLTVIGGYSELILDDLSSESAIYSDVEEIRQAAERAASLTRQLLAFSRRQVLNPKRISLSAVAADADRMLRRLIGEDVELVTRLDPSLGAVQADPVQIEQMIVNLAVNSRYAMPEGGRITIETANVDLEEAQARPHDGQAGPHVMLTFSDNGEGMNEETLSQAFEPFFTTKQKGQGTGLGLSMVYGIVKQSGGMVWAESTPGMGTTFNICLPRVEGTAEEVLAETTDVVDLRGTETVLLVEDEVSVRRMVRDILTEAGYTVLEAGEGEAALELARRSKRAIDLLLTDVVMPHVGGRELSESLTEAYPDVKVVYMSGYTDQAIPDPLFLHKPFSRSDLLGKVREVLDAS